MTYRPPFPDDADVADSREERQATEHRGPQPGRVERYDATTQTADVQPLVSLPVPQPNGSYEQEAGPVIPCVPVLWLRTSRAFVVGKLRAGDFVTLLPCEGDWSPWWAGDGSPADPGDLRRHHLAHCLAVPGFYPRGKSIVHVPGDGEELVLGVDGGARIVVKEDGTIELAGAAALALAAQTDAIVSSLQAVIAGLAPVPVPVPGLPDVNAALKAAIAAWTPESTAASKVKGA